jgi:hypothetical protein
MNKDEKGLLPHLKGEYKIDKTTHKRLIRNTQKSTNNVGIGDKKRNKNPNFLKSSGLASPLTKGLDLFVILSISRS